MSEPNDYIDNKVQHYRTLKEMTQEELALRAGVCRQTIIAMEKGNYTPSLAVALRISNVFGVPVEKIFSLNRHLA